MVGILGADERWTRYKYCSIELGVDKLCSQVSDRQPGRWSSLSYIPRWEGLGANLGVLRGIHVKAMYPSIMKLEKTEAPQDAG